MNVKEYNQLSSARKSYNWLLPDKYFTDGEFDVNNMLRSLESSGQVGYDIYGRMIFSPEFVEQEPDAFELLNSILRDDEQARMDEMVDSGDVDQSLDEDGKTLYFDRDGKQLMNSRGPMW